MHVRGSRVPPGAALVVRGLPGGFEFDAPPVKLTSPDPRSAPLAPDQGAQLSAQPVVQLLEAHLHLRQPEVSDPTADHAAEPLRDPVGPNGLAKKTVIREIENWVMADSPYEFDHIVPPEIRMANYEKLKERGERGQGRRGVPRSREPNAYPLEVICGTCGKPMHGSRHEMQRRFKCATYMNSNGKACTHNWIERDRVVEFVINVVRKQVTKDGSLEQIRSAVRTILEKYAKRGPAAKTAVARLEDRLASLERQRQRAYHDKTAAADELVQEDAQNLYETLLDEYRGLKKKVEMAKARSAGSSTDIEAEVEACMALLGKLHKFIKKVPEDRLRKTFNALGVRLTVYFGKAETGRRQNVPVGGKLEFGVNGPTDIPTAIKTENAAASGDTTALGVEYRGERI